MKSTLHRRGWAMGAGAVLVVGGLLIVCRMTPGCPLALWAEDRTAARKIGEKDVTRETKQAPNPSGDHVMSNVDSNTQSEGRVLHAGRGDFTHKVLESDVPVLVDFYADWCGPCQRLAPTLDDLAREMPSAKVVKVNVDDSPELAMQYGVSSIPALAVFKDGQVTAQHVGLASKDQLKALLRR